MDRNGSDNSIKITRLEMEENIFEQPSTSGASKLQRGSTHTISRSVQSFIVENESKLTRYSVPVVFGSVLAQVVLGVLSNSVSLISDAARQFADHVERHHFDRTAVPFRRIAEILLIAATCIVLAILCIAFLVLASGRTLVQTVQINSTYLLIGAILSATTNAFQLALHSREWKARPTYSTIAYFKEHRNQALHGLLYHSLANTILIVAILIFISKDYQISDNIGTYVIVFLTITNIASTSTKCYREYMGLEHAQDEYESL